MVALILSTHSRIRLRPSHPAHIWTTQTSTRLHMIKQNLTTCVTSSTTFRLVRSVAMIQMELSLYAPLSADVVSAAVQPALRTRTTRLLKPWRPAPNPQNKSAQRSCSLCSSYKGFSIFGTIGLWVRAQARRLIALRTTNFQLLAILSALAGRSSTICTSGHERVKFSVLHLDSYLLRYLTKKKSALSVHRRKSWFEKFKNKW